jgi:hypothetical protein
MGEANCPAHGNRAEEQETSSLSEMKPEQQKQSESDHYHFHWNPAEFPFQKVARCGCHAIDFSGGPAEANQKMPTSPV